MASFLNDTAREGIRKLDKNSPLTRELSALDVDAILKEDIHQICEEVTFPEMVKIMSLGAKYKLGSGDGKRIKEDLKTMAKAIEERIERKKGKLKTPVSCRDLLFNL
ncbi:MAG: hypothetical protein HQL18_00250 [Candidatus Omnitrophica bacterium]|nr:hypothetical protein [Candidatus Omnitrophota bacterium]